jgi:hypothetical protein
MTEIKIVTSCGEFDVGQTITRDSHIAAYFTGMLNELGDKETTLSAAEIVRTIKATDTKGMSPEDAETTYIEALQELEAGGSDDDMPSMTPQAAVARQTSAQNMASKLNGQFNAHLVAVLDAGDTVKKGPMWAADDTRSKWTRDEITAMPLPGTKPPKGADLSKLNTVYDYYKVTSSSGETLRSSYYADIIAATAEGERVHKRVQELVDENAKAKDQDLQDNIKLERKRLTDAATLLRRGLSINLCLWAFEALPLLVVEVQREANGEPLRTLYPVTVHQKGMSGSRKSLTLGQLLGLLKLDNNGDNGFDRCLAKGGTIKAFIDYALPKKKNGKQKKAIVVASPDTAYDVFFALNNYFKGGGDAAVLRMLSGPKAEAWVLQFGDFMSAAVPIWNSTDVAERYKQYNIDTAKQGGTRDRLIAGSQQRKAG